MCPICGASAKDFMENAIMHPPKFKPRHEALKYGISPLHGSIQFFEFVLKIAYRLKLKKWQVRDENGKKKWRNKKRRFRSRCRIQ